MITKEDGETFSDPIPFMDRNLEELTDTVIKNNPVIQERINRGRITRGSVKTFCAFLQCCDVINRTDPKGFRESLERVGLIVGFR